METLLTMIENFVGPYYETIMFALMLGFGFGLTRDIGLAVSLCLVFSIVLVFITGSQIFGYGAIVFSIILLALKYMGF